MKRSSKIILFDWGGVVEKHDNGYTPNQAKIDLIKLYNPNLTDKYILNNWVNALAENQNIEQLKNQEALKKWFELMKETFSINVSLEEFTRNYKKIYDKIDYYQDVVKFIHSLKNKCKIGILSNLIIFDQERIDKQMNLIEFDYTYLSYEKGLIKPDINIFKQVLKDLKMNSKDILFIDDEESNALPAYYNVSYVKVWELK